jgi:hypothetical protein
MGYIQAVEELALGIPARPHRIAAPGPAAATCKIALPGAENAATR